ncbi:MAG: hypothetical protein ACYDIC_12810 [Desulfobaccales bacterium]
MESSAKSIKLIWGTEYREKALSKRLVSGLALGAGLVLCLLALLGWNGKLCLTEGCQIYRGYKLWGFSLHHLGGAAFALGLFWLYKKSSLYADFIRLCLWGETALLAFQTVFLPCSECLLIGLIWGLVGLLTIPRHKVMKVWAVLFLATLAMLGKDLIKPWPVYGGQDSEVKVFFSPSCKHCRDTILNMMAGGLKGEDVAFLPVALEGDDVQRIAKFQQVLSEKLNLWQAFQACWGTPEPCSLGLLGWLKLHIGLFRNKMVLARMGANEVPLVLSKAMAWGGTAGGGCSFAEERENCAHN